jgi:UDP-N-acetyl-2-amino-2-deoxyglucuronate dehydrogenase
MQFALIGTGFIGEIHAQTIDELTPEATLAVVVDRDPTRTTEAAARHGAEPSLSIERTLARDDIDAVAICTPSGTHADLCVRALEPASTSSSRSRSTSPGMPPTAWSMPNLELSEC